MPSFKVEVTGDAEVDFDVYCAKCGAGLCNNADTRASRRRGMPQVAIEPCERCLDAAREEGAAKAMEEAVQRLTAEAKMPVSKHEYERDQEGD